MSTQHPPRHAFGDNTLLVASSGLPFIGHNGITQSPLIAAFRLKHGGGFRYRTFDTVLERSAFLTSLAGIFEKAADLNLPQDVCAAIETAQPFVYKSIEPNRVVYRVKDGIEFEAIEFSDGTEPETVDVVFRGLTAYLNELNV